MKKQELKLKVENIDCPGCATDMESVLLQLDGILKVNANYAEETLTVTYDSYLITDREVVSAVRGMGFRAERT